MQRLTCEYIYIYIYIYIYAAKVKTRGQELSSQMQEGLKSSEMVSIR